MGSVSNHRKSKSLSISLIDIKNIHGHTYMRTLNSASVGVHDEATTEKQLLSSCTNIPSLQVSKVCNKSNFSHSDKWVNPENNSISSKLAKTKSVSNHRRSKSFSISPIDMSKIPDPASTRTLDSAPVGTHDTENQYYKILQDYADQDAISENEIESADIDLLSVSDINLFKSKSESQKQNQGDDIVPMKKIISIPFGE